MHPELAVFRMLDVQADAEKALFRGAGLAQQELAAHPEVCDDGLTRIPARERYPEELAAPGGALHPSSGEERVERARDGVVPFQRPRLEHLHAEDGRPRDRGCQPGTDDLDLRKLWHDVSSTGSRRSERRTSRPASCSCPRRRP